MCVKVVPDAICQLISHCTATISSRCSCIIPYDSGCLLRSAVCDASSCVDICGMFSSSTCMQGQSWCIGGDSNASTIASFLRFYTPDIQGASLGTHLASVLTQCFTFYITAWFLTIPSSPCSSPNKPLHIYLCTTFSLPLPPPPSPPTHTVPSFAMGYSVLPFNMNHPRMYLMRLKVGQ